MFKGSARSRSGKLVALAGVLTVASAFASAPAAHAGRSPSTTTTYNVTLGLDATSDTVEAGLFGDAGGTYTSQSAFSFQLAGGTGRSYSLSLAGGLTVPNFQCNVGMVFGGDNPLVTCYEDASQDNGYFIDFPPYGNDNKRNRVANPACAKFETTSTGTTTTVPGDCYAMVSVTKDGQAAGGYSKVSMPFTLTTQTTASTP